MQATSDMVAFQAGRFAATAWFILVIAVAIGFWRIENLGSYNKERIQDIQSSRYESCRTTYESFHTIFDPFLPPPGKRTAQQRHDLKKFNAIIDKKIKECHRQVTPGP